MRTTLTIDDDVLVVAKVRADREGVSLGAVVSAMARKGMRSDRAEQEKSPVRNGIRLLTKHGGQPVTLEMINAIRDDE